jgi:RNA polymerase sigma-B factor
VRVGVGARAVTMFVEYQRTGDRDLRNRIIEANLGLAESVAHRYSGRGENHEDLSQVAMLGLLRAVERFDPERGLAFSSFAIPTIEGEIKRHFRDKRWSVRMPRRLQEMSLEVNRSVAELSQRLGRSPSISEIADDLGRSEEQVLEALEAGRASSATSLDAGSPRRQGGEADATPMDRLGETDVGHDHVEHAMLVETLLRTLPDRERAMVVLRFYDGMTQSQIADRFGVSQMQVSRMLSRSLEQLHAVMEH